MLVTRPNTSLNTSPNTPLNISGRPVTRWGCTALLALAGAITGSVTGAMTGGISTALAQSAKVPSSNQAADQASPAAQAPTPTAKPRRTTATKPAPQPAAEVPCGPTAIGVSRTQEIDATNGPRFGHQQYKEQEFLKDGEIVLTFDDGPSSIYTPRVIEALNFHCTKATFYMVGSRALAEPKIVQEIHRRGHTIGTHTWSHANLRNIGFERAKPEFELGFSGVQKALGKPIAPFFRFPYLADSRAMMDYSRTRHMAMFSIDMDAYDYKTLNPAEVHAAIMRQVLAQRKGIILFHDIQPATAGALKALLTELKAKGFKVVHTVPKGYAQTLSPYDLQANVQLAQRTMAAQANPLVTRSPTWGRAGDAAALPGPASAATGGTPPTLPAPWTPNSGPPFPPATQPVQPPRRVEDSDWRNRILRQ
jgi:peptidoglycan-N-acetylglucosamine deacetylase